MPKLTVVIPSRNEIFLSRTVDEVFAKARGDVECIVGLDAVWENPLPADRPNLTIIHWGRRGGHRQSINAAAEIGKGQYLMKLDAHCVLDEGYDVKLMSNCDDDWMVIPRRYSLDFQNWRRAEKTPVDYEYIRYPYNEAGEFIGTTAVYYWMSRQKARAQLVIDDAMIAQGSCMFLPMRYFRRLMYPMDTTSYGYYIGEQFEMMLKTWLSGGRCVVNKSTWYAHLWKGDQYKAHYLAVTGTHLPKRDDHDSRAAGIEYQTRYWLGNKWEGRLKNIEWLIDRFSPVPGWPEDRAKWTL